MTDPTPTSLDLSRAFKALGDPNRLAIMQRLIRMAVECRPPDGTSSCTLDDACCNFGDLVDDLDVSKATVSHHLKELDRAGLIERIREGRRLYVRANLERIAALRRSLDPGPSAGPASAPDLVELNVIPPE